MIHFLRYSEYLFQLRQATKSASHINVTISLSISFSFFIVNAKINNQLATYNIFK